MKGFNAIKFAAFALFVALAFANVTPAFAVDYYWKYQQTGSTNFPDASSACKAYLTQYWPTASTYAYKSHTVSFASDGKTGTCNGVGYLKSNPNTTTTTSTTLYRFGDGCSTGMILNPSTGGCMTPSPSAGNICPGVDARGFNNTIDSTGECVSLLRADLPAQCKYFALNKGVLSVTFKTLVNDSSEPVVPPAPEKMGCEIEFLTAASCKYKPRPPSSVGVSYPDVQGSCTIAYQFTGNVAGNSQTSLDAADLPAGKEGLCAGGVDSAACGPDTPSDSKENNPCIYSVVTSGATGTTSTCVSSSFEGQSGNMQCGQVDGKNVCVTKPTASEGQKIDTTVKTVPNADGSSTSTKTDVATKTSCPTGVSNCKVTTTTTVTTTHKGADGSVAGTSTQTTCQGAECSTSGSGGGNSGKGDDTTNCDPSTDPKACEGGSTDGGGKKCDAPIQCDGDAVMCAILQQQHKDTCELMAEPSDEEKSKLEQDKAAEVSKVDALQDELDDKASGLFADFQAKASGNQYGGQCLQDKPVEVFGSTFTLPLSQICPYLVLLRYALIAMAYLAAARIVSRGI